MLNDRKVYINGKFVEWGQASVHLMSHSFARGSAIFEVISFHKPGGGTAVFRLDEHVNRLFGTADLLLMELPLSKQATEAAVLETVRMNHLEQGFIKLVCYYGMTPCVSRCLIGKRINKGNAVIKEGSAMKKTTKEIKKDKKFWADPMCYPVFTAK